MIVLKLLMFSEIVSDSKLIVVNAAAKVWLYHHVHFFR